MNKISGEWDEVKLQPLLEEISLSEFDIELTGFEEYEIAELSFINDIEYDDDFDLNDDDLAPEEKEISSNKISCPFCGEEFEP